ncbi:MAG TPA: DinB family protein [Gammaproteobacteria bacterium]|nr:DinB family protein [Gammaproteobacteria bacterium]
MHSLINYAQTMSRYNRWMNQRIYDACATLDDEERKRDVGAVFRSIHGTLNHILVADRVWMGRFAGDPVEFRALDEELCADFTELRAERQKQDEGIIAWSESLTVDELNGELTYTSTVSPRSRKYPFWFAVMHFFNHQTHHRGEATTVLSQTGIDPGVTDLILLPEYQSAPVG